MCSACKHLPAGNTCWTTAQYDQPYGEKKRGWVGTFALQLNMSLHHFSPQTCGRPADEANRKNIVKTYHVKATRQHNRFGSQQLCFFTAAMCGPEARYGFSCMRNCNTRTLLTPSNFIKRGLILSLSELQNTWYCCDLWCYREIQDHREFKDHQD